MSEVLTAELPLARPPERVDRVPAEFLGRARQLRQRLVASARTCGEAIDRVTAKALQRHRRHPFPRQPQLTDLARCWRYRLPAFGRLDLQIEQGKRALTIREMRCDASDFRDVGWEEDERGICVIAMELSIAPGRFEYSQTPLLAISLHGLARRFERGVRVTDETVMAELHRLALGSWAACWL